MKIKMTFEFVRYEYSKLATFLSMLKSGFSGFMAWVGLFLIPLAITCTIYSTTVGYADIPALIIGIICIVSYVALFFIDEEQIAQKAEGRAREKEARKAEERSNDPVWQLVVHFSHINHAYSLGIPEDALVRILSSENILAEFEKNITLDKPTVNEFSDKMLAMLLSLLREMKLAREKFIELTTYCLGYAADICKAFSQEDIDNLAKIYSKDIPDELSFLRGKINYELSALGILAQYAQENNDNMIAAKVESIRRQRGYTSDNAPASTADTTEDEPSWGKF